MTKLPLAALLLTGCAHGPRVMCPGDEPVSMKAGESIVYNPPTCRFPLESYSQGPLLFR